MEENIKQDLQDLEVAAADREENLVDYTFKRFLNMVEDKKGVIDDLLKASTKDKERERYIMEFISKYIADILEGNLAVTEYNQKSMAKQTIFLYLGTHWEYVITQKYYDFVKACAKQMGLDDIYAEDHKFMCLVFERLAFRVMKHRQQATKRGEIWINVQNGTLEVKEDGSFTLREHRADDFFTYVLPFAYNPLAECHKWHKFLDQVLPEADVQTVLAECIGYCFTKNMKLEKMIVFYGTGSNGKSVVLDVTTHLMGGLHNVSNVSLSSLSMDDEKRSHIEHKLVNISHESGGELDPAIIKQLASGEPTEARKLYVGSHMMIDFAKLFTSYNKLPVAENTFGFYRRWMLIPFEVTIPEDEQDVDLTNKLCTELSGIFNWVLAALVGLLQRKAFTKAKKCTDALNDYKRNSKSSNMFFFDKCEIDGNSRMKLSELYNAYSRYCREEELPNKCGKKSFQDDLKAFGAKMSMYRNIIMYNVKFKNLEENEAL